MILNSTRAHASAFDVSTEVGDARTPEQWARAVFEEVPRLIRWFVLFGWRYVLGLQLGPSASPDHVAGWKILNRGPDVVILEARSTLLHAHKWRGLRTEAFG